MLRDIIVGFVALSTATSPNKRWVLGLPPKQQKVKKAVSEAAHNMINLNEESLPTQDIFNFLRIPGVIGKRE